MDFESFQKTEGALIHLVSDLRRGTTLRPLRKFYGFSPAFAAFGSGALSKIKSVGQSN
jgi:hypothetical protein